MRITEKVVSILRDTVLFAEIPEVLLSRIVDSMEVVSFAADEIVFEKGDPGTSMYIIVEGQVRVHDGDFVFNHLSDGDVFGEMAVLDPAVRSATITAKVDTTLCRLDQQSLYDLLAEQPEATRAIIRVLSQRLRDRTEDWKEDFLHRRALERELEIGREIQTSFLPRVLPQGPGWEIAAYFQAAREVAGDFYDAFPLPQEERIGLVIGDVCDKGVGAALFMTLFRSLIRAVTTSDEFMSAASAAPDAGEAKGQLASDWARLKSSITLTNQYIARTHGHTSMFATLFFALLDPVTGTLIYVNGGHEPPVILNAAGVKERLEPNAPAVGLFPGVDYEIGETRMELGDILFAFTDGVTEAKNWEDDLFGETKLFALLEGTERTASDFLQYIATHLRAYTADANPSDDITMLAVKRLAGSPPAT